LSLLVIENAKLREERDGARRLFKVLKSTTASREKVLATRIAELEAAQVPSTTGTVAKPGPEFDPEAMTAHTQAPSLRDAIKETAWGAGIRYIEDGGSEWEICFSIVTPGFRGAFGAVVECWKGVYFSDYAGAFDCVVDWHGATALVTPRPKGGVK